MSNSRETREDYLKFFYEIHGMHQENGRWVYAATETRTFHNQEILPGRILSGPDAVWVANLDMRSKLHGTSTEEERKIKDVFDKMTNLLATEEQYLNHQQRTGRGRRQEIQGNTLEEIKEQLKQLPQFEHILSQFIRKAPTNTTKELYEKLDVHPMKQPEQTQHKASKLDNFKIKLDSVRKSINVARTKIKNKVTKSAQETLESVKELKDQAVSEVRNRFKK